MWSAKEKKRLYDKEYRRKNKEKIKARKKAYYQANKKRLYEKKRARVDDDFRERHAEYCRKPDYVKRKKKYDRVLRSIKNCGEYWESDIIAIEILKECRKQSPDAKSRLYYKLNLNKTVKRNKDKRIAAALISLLNDSAGKPVLQRAWTKDRREFLESFCIMHEKKFI